MLDEDREELVDVLLAELSKKKWKLIREEFYTIGLMLVARLAVERGHKPNAAAWHLEGWVVEAARRLKAKKADARSDDPRPTKRAPVSARARRPRKG